MNRWLILTATGIVLAAGAWWLGYLPSCCSVSQEEHWLQRMKGAPLPVPAMEASPKINDLLNESFESRQLGSGTDQLPLIDHPSHLTTERIDGAMQ